MLGCSFSQVDDPELFGGSDNNGYGLKVALSCGSSRIATQSYGVGSNSATE
jgi:hypothetical protein